MALLQATDENVRLFRNYQQQLRDIANKVNYDLTLFYQRPTSVQERAAVIVDAYMTLYKKVKCYPGLVKKQSKLHQFAKEIE